MNESLLRYGAWGVLFAALLGWAGVGLFAWAIARDESVRTENIRSAREDSARHEVAVRLHALAADTERERARLRGLLDVDVLSAVDTLEAAAKAAKVRIQLSDAQADSAGAQSGRSNVKAIGFVVSGEGSYAALSRLLALFETLPLASSLPRFDLEHIAGGSGGPWRLNAYIRVLTTADISS